MITYSNLLLGRLIAFIVLLIVFAAVGALVERRRERQARTAPRLVAMAPPGVVGGVGAPFF